MASGVRQRFPWFQKASPPRHHLHLCWPFGMCWSSTSELNVLNNSRGRAAIHGRRGWVLSGYSSTSFLFSLQNVVSKSAIQFKGNSQHDAQEFLLWLLDRVHEDLNHIVHPDIRPQKVTSNWQHKYLQYFICAWIVSLCKGHHFILICHIFLHPFSFPASSGRTKCPWRITTTSTRLFCAGVVSGTIQVNSSSFTAESVLLYQSLICLKTHMTFNIPTWWYFSIKM